MRIFLVILISLLFTSCKFIPFKKPLFPSGPKYVPSLNHMYADDYLNYRSHNVINELSLLSYSTSKNVNYSLIEYSDLNNSFFLEKKKNIKTIESAKFQSIQLENELQLYNFRNYTLDYYDTVSLRSFKIILEDSNKIFKPNEEINFSSKFPNDLKNSFEESYYIFRVPLVSDCKALSSYGNIEQIYKPRYHYKFLVLNPYIHYYTSSIRDIWDDYQLFIHCQSIEIDTAKVNETTKQNLLKPKWEREYDKKLNKKFITEYKRILINDFDNNDSKMYKSYFELIFWQVYQPSNFNLKDNFGKYRSFFFTSNNPDYPGNYEVKFNIIEPYKFKVAKR